MLFHPAELLAYALAVLVLLVTPGPNMVLILTRSVSGGRSVGLVTCLGVELGTLVHTLLAAAGVSAIVATSAVAFNVVKFAGAAYLIYLGVRGLLSKEGAVSLEQRPAVGLPQAFWQAVLTNVLNPKVALFFLAFIPQFIHPERGSVFAQFVILGAMLATIGLCFGLSLTLGSSAIRGFLLRSPAFQQWQNRVVSLVFIGLGLRLALVQRN